MARAAPPVNSGRASRAVLGALCGAGLLFGFVRPAPARGGDDARVGGLAQSARYRLGLSVSGELEALRDARRARLELALAAGTERVEARLMELEATREGAELELELPRALDSGELAAVRGLLVRTDHARAGSSVGWTLGSLLGLVSADAALGSGSRSVPERVGQLAAGVAGGFLGGRAGRFLGAAWGASRGYLVTWIRPVAAEATDPAAGAGAPGIALPVPSPAP